MSAGQSIRNGGFVYAVTFIAIGFLIFFVHKSFGYSLSCLQLFHKVGHSFMKGNDVCFLLAIFRF